MKKLTFFLLLACTLCYMPHSVHAQSRPDSIAYYVLTDMSKDTLSYCPDVIAFYYKGDSVIGYHWGTCTLQRVSGESTGYYVNRLIALKTGRGFISFSEDVRSLPLLDSFAGLSVLSSEEALRKGARRWADSETYQRMYAGNWIYRGVYSAMFTDRRREAIYLYCVNDPHAAWDYVYMYFDAYVYVRMERAEVEVLMNRLCLKARR
ncbi:MAG: hypothetical protein PUG09_03490 [Prevotella sp.]|nr:hypothetical protein [Prevotella sp.]